ncbi:hypothetical protein O5D80_002237 [Batrachochytrium dendrobatidis]|nr:hypothetical protein O5D80_002237 [Batrachochytrium dendrobatidis]
MTWPLIWRGRTASIIHKLPLRNLWTTTTFTGPNSLKESTITDFCCNRIGAGKSPALAILLVNPHVPASQIEILPRLVMNALNPDSLIGAVVDAVSLPTNGPAFSLTLLTNESLQGADKPLVHAFAVPADLARKQRHRAVGRWPSALGSPLHSAPNLSILGFESISQRVTLDPSSILPDHLIQQRSIPSNLLLFTDDEPLDLMQSLNTLYPNATQLGLIGSRTPFLTGRPFTLFMNDQVLSGGAVGVSFSPSNRNKSDTTPSESALSRMELLYKNYTPISSPMVISRCRGNIILELNERNATRELLLKLQESNTSKTLDYKIYVRVKDPQSNAVGIYLLSGGDLAKGTLAVDTVHDLKKGMQIELLRIDHTLAIQCADSIASIPSILEFTTIPENGAHNNDPNSKEMISNGVHHPVSAHNTTHTSESPTLVAMSELGVLCVDSKHVLGNWQVINTPYAHARFLK